MGYKIIKLIDIYNSIGESDTKELLKTFKCDLNPEVDYFLHEKAIEFSKQGIAETFIVTAPYKGQDVIVGYFSTSNKAITIKRFFLSNTKKKRLLKFAKYNDIVKAYTIALPLIGQLSKNYYNNYNTLISGDVLLKLACDKIKTAQDVLGGRFVFLECEDKPQLKNFYESNGFVCFCKRNLEKDERTRNEGEYFLQMLCDLSKKQ